MIGGVERVARRSFDGYLEGRSGAQPDRAYGLTAIELANLRWLSHGLSQCDTARARGVSYDTVKTQIESAKGKLAAKSTTHAVALAIRHKLIL